MGHTLAPQLSWRKKGAKLGVVILQQWPHFPYAVEKTIFEGWITSYGDKRFAE